MARLLAIVSVDPGLRVRCRAPGCKRTVYAKIHVVETDEGTVEVLGSTCYGLIYEGALSQKSVYTGGSSRQLTEEERCLLEQNTAALIREFQKELEQQEVSIHPRQEVPLPTPEPAPPLRPLGTTMARTSSSLVGGHSRTVKCHFCGEKMETHLPLAPAIGYKCQSCRDNGVTTSLAARKRMARGRRW